MARNSPEMFMRLVEYHKLIIVTSCVCTANLGSISKVKDICYDVHLLVD